MCAVGLELEFVDRRNRTRGVPGQGLHVMVDATWAMCVYALCVSVCVSLCPQSPRVLLRMGTGMGTGTGTGHIGEAMAMGRVG